MLERSKRAWPEIVVVNRDQTGSIIRDTLAAGVTAVLKGEAGGDSAFDFARSTNAGLSTYPRRLECRYLYDAQGSALFDLITQQPEYYLTRTEAAILAANACRIRELTGPVTLMELGSGYSVKTNHLLQAWLACDPEVSYIPVDVSEAALCQACQTICNLHLTARVIGVNGEYRDAFPVIREVSPVIVVFLGSTIGNFEPGDESCFLAELSCNLSPGDFFLVGIDLVKDKAVIEPAYNDAAGVTAGFTRNLFARMNRELGSSIDLSAVEHVAYYNSSSEQVDIYARFTRGQAICVWPLAKSFEVAEGEMVETEISRKYRLGKYIPYLEGFGFETEGVFTDEQEWFALVLLKRTDSLTRLPGRRV